MRPAGATPADPRRGLLFDNAPSLVLLAVFLAFLASGLAVLAAHGGFGLLKHNEDQAIRHLPPDGLAAYLASAGFWRSVFQGWQAEVFALVGFVGLTIFLRQENSPESKPVEAAADSTGETDA